MSILDEKKPQLDPSVWGRAVDGTYSLRPEMSSAIRRRTRKLLTGVPVRHAYIVGSITGYYYNEHSDIDVTLVVDADDAVVLGLVERALHDINGRNAPGTKHPINFFIHNDRVNMNAFDGVYDLKRDMWLKKPTDLGVDLFAIYDRFTQQLGGIDAQIGEAWRSLVDIERLRDAIAYGGSVEVQRKLARRIDTLDDAINQLVSEYDETHQARIDAFHRQLELAEQGMNPYPSPNLVPENIRYKVLERYHYIDFLKKLRQILEDSGGKINTARDVRAVRDAFTHPVKEYTFAQGFLGKALGPERL